jgi:hypothetical protein
VADVERLVLVVVIAVVAAVVAAIMQKRLSPDAPVPTGYNVPAQLHRSDFNRPDAPYLVVVFTSATCHTCAGIWEKVEHLESDAVAVQAVEVSADGDLHDRYGIDGVPTTVIADAVGVVRKSFLGPATATDIWAAVAEVREPGSVPESCHEHEPNAHDTPKTP